jgi:predicted membrane-bound spermidine synthase
MSPRGALVVAERDGQTQLLLHRSAIMTAAPSPASEQIALLSASLVDAPRDVLIVGVAPAFALRSLRSMGATRIDEVVGDPRIADQVRIHAPDAADPGVTVVGQDERAFVRALPAGSLRPRGGSAHHRQRRSPWRGCTRRSSMQA